MKKALNLLNQANRHDVSSGSTGDLMREQVFQGGGSTIMVEHVEYIGKMKTAIYKIRA